MDYTDAKIFTLRQRRSLRTLQQMSRRQVELCVPTMHRWRLLVSAHGDLCGRDVDQINSAPSTKHTHTDTYRQWDVHRQTATHSHRHPGTHRARHSYHCHIQLQEWTKHKSNLYSALCCHRIKLLAISMTAWKLLNLTRIYTV